MTLPTVHLVTYNTTFDQRVVHFVFLHSLRSRKYIYEQKTNPNSIQIHSILLKRCCLLNAEFIHVLF